MTAESISTPRGSKMNSEKKKGTLQVIINRCPQNHPCPSLTVCPMGALSQKGFAAPVVDHNKCIACKKCAQFCPMGALVVM
jgi:ferredoxin